ncbi:unnamed protein product [Clavelina lepadiformis]|uniref:PID domain-containing protein n=1 Tax=Clavelina lepadiformis TaxID=159417 RepID=A0ABP0FLL2_CLALP
MPSTLKLVSTKKKHKKLNENWMEIKPAVVEGLKFTAKYIGMTLVDSPKGEEMASAAIKRIVDTNKAYGKNSEIVLLTISPRGIHVKNATNDEMMYDIDITRISFCTADKIHGKVFGYVAQNPSTEAFECHGYMLGSRKEAQSLTLTVAQAFRIAYDVCKNDEDVSDLLVSTNHRSGDSSPSASGEKKPMHNIYHSIADSRYKRLSDSFEVSAQVAAKDTTMTDNTAKDTPSPEESEITLPIRFAMKPAQVAKEKSSNCPPVSIVPPPSAKGKASSRSRVTPTANLIDISLSTEIDKENLSEDKQVPW